VSIFSISIFSIPILAYLFLARIYTADANGLLYSGANFQMWTNSRTKRSNYVFRKEKNWIAHGILTRLYIWGVCPYMSWSCAIYITIFWRSWTCNYILFCYFAWLMIKKLLSRNYCYYKLLSTETGSRKDSKWNLNNVS
jgi:hypothetical protein